MTSGDEINRTVLFPYIVRTLAGDPKRCPLDDMLAFSVLIAKKKNAF